MLSSLLRIGSLTKQEREAFESMWDQTHRSSRGELSNRQRAWIEKVYYAQHLDTKQERAAKKIVPKTGFIYDPTATRTRVASNIKQFEVLCPSIKKDDPTYQRVESFFRNGGERFELRAGEKPTS
jgi:hypothetical protein